MYRDNQLYNYTFRAWVEVSREANNKGFFFSKQFNVHRDVTELIEEKLRR